MIQVSPNGWTDREIALEWLQHFNNHTAIRTRGQYRLLIMDGHSSHCSLESVEYCAAHQIIALCLPPHSTHELQPLDVGIFGPLAKEYRSLVSEGALFGAQRVNNLQFLHYYQKTRKTITKNIPSAWRGAGLVPFDPHKVLNRHRPITPPFATVTDERGRQLNIPVNSSTAARINEIMEEVFQRIGLP